MYCDRNGKQRILILAGSQRGNLFFDVLDRCAEPNNLAKSVLIAEIIVTLPRAATCEQITFAKPRSAAWIGRD
jgi:hypothetical protein